MYKQNRGLMTTQTKQTTSDQVDYKSMIEEIANDYSQMYNSNSYMDLDIFCCFYKRQQMLDDFLLDKF